MPDLLLDTQAALWRWTGQAGLAPAARAAIETSRSVGVSAISAQALATGLTVVTCDAAIANFGCKVLW